VPIRRKLQVAFGAGSGVAHHGRGYRPVRAGPGQRPAPGGLSDPAGQGLRLPPNCRTTPTSSSTAGALRPVRPGPGPPRRRPAPAQPVPTTSAALQFVAQDEGQLLTRIEATYNQFRDGDDEGDHAGRARGKLTQGSGTPTYPRQAPRRRARASHQPAGEQGGGEHRQPGRRQPGGLTEPSRREFIAVCPGRRRPRPAPGLRHFPGRSSGRSPRWAGASMSWPRATSPATSEVANRDELGTLAKQPQPDE